MLAVGLFLGMHLWYGWAAWIVYHAADYMVGFHPVLLMLLPGMLLFTLGSIFAVIRKWWRIAASAFLCSGRSHRTTSAMHYGFWVSRKEALYAWSRQWRLSEPRCSNGPASGSLCSGQQRKT